MATDYDVIIIGAGPAGASCAKHLVENGVKTLIIEKKKLPRYKCCSGLISNRAIDFIEENFGNIPDDIICSNKYYNFKFSINGYNFINIPGPRWINVKREHFDYWLINQSKSEIIEKSFFTDYIEEDDVITVNIKMPDREYKLKCKYLIGADGGNSFVRKKIDDSYKTREMILLKQIIYEGKTDIDKNYFYYIKNRNISDIFSCFNIKDNLLYICTSYLPGNFKANYDDTLYDIINKNYEIQVKHLRKEICIFDLRYGDEKFLFGKNNTILIGEAAGLVTYTGEGISSALISGKYAAESIIESIRTDLNLLDIYTKKTVKEKKYVKNLIKALTNL